MRDESRNVSLRGRRQLSHLRVREVMVVVAGISIYVTGVAYWFLPDLVSSGVAIAAVVCVLMTVALTRTRIKMPPLAPTAVLFIALMLFVPDAIMRKTFGDTDIEAFIFHLRNGIAGTPISDYFPQIIATALSLASIMVSIAAFGSAVKTRGGILFIAAGVLFLVNPMTSRSIVVLADNYLPSPLLKKIVDPVVALPSSVLPDIFVIFLEGTDMRFSDRAVYGNSFEHIEALKSEALPFLQSASYMGRGTVLQAWSPLSAVFLPYFRRMSIFLPIHSVWETSFVILDMCGNFLSAGTKSLVEYGFSTKGMAIFA